MKKTLLCSILLLTGQAYADFSREQVIGKWICAADMTESLTEEDSNSSHSTMVGASLAEYTGTGFSSEKVVVSLIMNTPDKIKFTYKIEADGSWKLASNNRLESEIKSVKVHKIHDAATRKKIATSKEIREMEEELYKFISDTKKINEENTPDIIIELENDSMRLQGESVLTVCTRI